MSLKIKFRRKPQIEVRYPRLSRVQETYRHGVSNAVERVSPTVDQVRTATAGRVLVARGWSAPRLQRAGRYVESDLGPRVGSFLSTTGQRIEPAGRSRKRGRNAVIFLTAATMVGAIGAMASRRNGQHAAHDDVIEPLRDTSAPVGSDRVNMS